MGIFDSGIMIEINQGEKFKFGSFSERDLALERIKALWMTRGVESTDQYSNTSSV
jgi:hypothetical protein